MLIRLDVDQVRVVGLWGFGAQPIWGWADMGMGQHGAWPKWGRADMGMMPTTQSRKFENKSNKMRILAIPMLKLRAALNAVAFSTYTVKISDLKVVLFMVYTYNIQGQCYGTRHRQMMLVKFP